MPESGTVMPIIMRMEVVLPEPFGPSRPNMVPGSIVKREAFDGDLGVVDLADILQARTMGMGSRVRRSKPV